jgi:hypothetical protein
MFFSPLRFTETVVRALLNVSNLRFVPAVNVTGISLQNTADPPR